MAGEFIERPTAAWIEYLHANRRARGWAEGRMAMALEIITVRKSLQAVGMLGVDRASVLDTLLVDQGLEEAEKIYEGLGEWRRLKVKRDDAFGVDPRPSSAESHPRAHAPGLGTPLAPGRGRTIPPSDAQGEPTNEVEG